MTGVLEQCSSSASSTIEANGALMGVKKIGEHGLAMLQTSIADTAHYHDGLIVSIFIVIMVRLKAFPH